MNFLLNGKFGKLLPEQYEMIKLTSVSSKYMSNLVNTIVTNYQCNEQNLILNKSTFDLIDVIEDVKKEAEYIAFDKNQNIIFKHSYDNCLICADKLQIKRVITNFLSNAVTYGFKNTDIVMELKQTKSRISFCVKDKSNPICQKDLKSIFRKFSKTSNSKYNNESTGLGLYISKRIIDMHNGKIYAKNLSSGFVVFGFNIRVPVVYDRIQLKCLQKAKLLKY